MEQQRHLSLSLSLPLKSIKNNNKVKWAQLVEKRAFSLWNCKHYICKTENLRAALASVSFPGPLGPQRPSHEFPAFTRCAPPLSNRVSSLVPFLHQPDLCTLPSPHPKGPHLPPAHKIIATSESHSPTGTKNHPSCCHCQPASHSPCWLTLWPRATPCGPAQPAAYWLPWV